MINTCKFCSKRYSVELYTFECQDCQVRYIASNDYIAITYELGHLNTIYNSIFMSFTENRTIVWFQPRAPVMKKVEVPTTFPDLHPRDALALAQRLDKLKAFT